MRESWSSVARHRPCAGETYARMRRIIQRGIVVTHRTALRKALGESVEDGFAGVEIDSIFRQVQWSNEAIAAEGEKIVGRDDEHVVVDDGGSVRPSSCQHGVSVPASDRNDDSRHRKYAVRRLRQIRSD